MPHALCVARHRYLSNHLGTFFGRFGLTSTCVVGLQEAIDSAGSCGASLVICDYDLMAVVPLDEWERHRTLSRLPLIAVSMTRLPSEMHPLDVSGVAGFLYLPSLAPAEVRRLIGSYTTPYSVPSPETSAGRAMVTPL